MALLTRLDGVRHPGRTPSAGALAMTSTIFGRKPDWRGRNEKLEKLVVGAWPITDMEVCRGWQPIEDGLYDVRRAN